MNPWNKTEFEKQLRAKGDRYHIHHPFHVAMNSGRCTRPQVQGWVLNRFYYQVGIPIKDAAILANCPEVEIRRAWISRIIDHDGTATEPGGIESWLRLGVSKKLARDMGHLPQSGPGGMLEALKPLAARKVLIHINNTNPILDEDSPERAVLHAAGIEVAYDGMEFEL